MVTFLAAILVLGGALFLGDNRCRVEGVTFWAGIDFVWNKDYEFHTFDAFCDLMIFLFDLTFFLI